MYLVARKNTKLIYPDFGIKNNDVFFLEIAKELVRERKGVISENMVVTDLYGNCLYEKIPVPDNTALWRWWSSLLDIDSSGKTRNGFVFVGKI